MEITKKEGGSKKDRSIDIFEISGKLDVTGSQKAQEIIIPAICEGGKIIIDMTRCEYVASSGLRVMLIVAKQSAIANCKTVLAGVQPLVWDVIALTGFEDVLESYPSQADAIAVLT